MSNGAKTLFMYLGMIAWGLGFLWLSDILNMPELRIIAIIPILAIGYNNIFLNKPKFLFDFCEEQIEKDRIRMEQGKLISFRNFSILFIAFSTPLFFYLILS